MKQTIIASLTFFIMMISGCTSPKPMYEYGNYSKSFYNLKKTGDDEAISQWKTALEESIELSNAQAIRIPPGVYANLGYLYLKVNDADRAISYFEAEKALYPESTVFMEKLIKKAELMKEGQSKS